MGKRTHSDPHDSSLGRILCHVKKLKQNIVEGKSVRWSAIGLGDYKGSSCIYDSKKIILDSEKTLFHRTTITYAGPTKPEAIQINVKSFPIFYRRELKSSFEFSWRTFSGSIWH